MEIACSTCVRIRSIIISNRTLCTRTKVPCTLADWLGYFVVMAVFAAGDGEENEVETSDQLIEVQVHIVRGNTVVSSSSLVQVDDDTLAVIVGVDDQAHLAVYQFILERVAEAFAETDRHRELLHDEGSGDRSGSEGKSGPLPF